MTTDEVKAKGISSFWVLVMVVPIIIFANGLVIHWTNASQDRQQAAYRRDQDRRQAQFRHQLEAKFQLALRISTQQANYSINKGVCGWRKVFGPTVNDKRIPAPRRRQIGAFLDNQITVPPDFKCRDLPKKPPK